MGEGVGFGAGLQQVADALERVGSGQQGADGSVWLAILLNAGVDGFRGGGEAENEAAVGASPPGSRRLDEGTAAGGDDLPLAAGAQAVDDLCFQLPGRRALRRGRIFHQWGIRRGGRFHRRRREGASRKAGIGAVPTRVFPVAMNPTRMMLAGRCAGMVTGWAGPSPAAAGSGASGCHKCRRCRSRAPAARWSWCWGRRR